MSPSALEGMGSLQLSYGRVGLRLTRPSAPSCETRHGWRAKLARIREVRNGSAKSGDDRTAYRDRSEPTD